MGGVIMSRELGNSPGDAACAIKRSVGSLRTHFVDSLLRQHRADLSVFCSNHSATTAQTEEGLSKMFLMRLRAKLGFTNDFFEALNVQFNPSHPRIHSSMRL